MIFFTADNHFFHGNILLYCRRPFRDVEEMNEEMVRRWNLTVSDDDIVYHLGDFALGNCKRIAKIRQRLKGKIFMIAGNHDYNTSKSKWISELGIEYHEEPVELAEFLLCHYPYEGDSQETDRYLAFRPKVTDKWLLHGHIHDLWKIKDPRQYNVGVDVHSFYPISIDQVREDIKKHMETQ